MILSHSLFVRRPREYDRAKTRAVSSRRLHFEPLEARDLLSLVDLVSAVGTTLGDGNSFNEQFTVSADGRYLAFDSASLNLVVGDTNGWSDVFAKDMQTGIITRASTDSNGNQGDKNSYWPTISADARYVAFLSAATNLVPGDTNSATDVFVKDLQTRTTTRVSTDDNGIQGNAECGYGPIALSADGRYIAFSSRATNLVSGDTNATWDVFVKDLQTGTTTRVSTDSAGNQGNSLSNQPAMSADGRYVAFSSWATNLVSGDTNGAWDVFVKDVQTGLTTRVSTDSTGVQGNGGSAASMISTDGRYVAFLSDATNLVAGDTNSSTDVFVKDVRTGAITRASTDSSGNQAAGALHYTPFGMSADGRYVAFSCYATNLVAGDTNNAMDVFVKDVQTGAIARVSTDSSGNQARGGDSENPAISSDGRYIAFDSFATNLVSGGTNGRSHVYRVPNPFGPPNPTTFNGAGGDDRFAFSADATHLYVNVTLAGQATQNYTYDASLPVTLTFNGGGNDKITIDGGPLDETVVTHPGSVTFSGPAGTYQVIANGMSDIRVTAGAGTGQTATMYDSAGADTFTASPGFASMSGPGYYDEAQGFQNQYGYGSFVYGQPGQGDRANLYDGPGNDTWFGYGPLNYSEITGPGGLYYVRAQGFDLQYGYVTAGGTDNVARFYDTPGDDVFNAKGDYSYLAGVNTQTWWYASGFQRVYAQKVSGGGFDRAFFSHTTGNYKATLNVRSYQGYMADSTGTFYNIASDFNEYEGVASIPGNTDEAYFRTTGGGDTLTFAPVAGTNFAIADLLGTTPPPASKPVHLYAYGFHSNTIMRDTTDTAFNQATLTGTAGNDTFVGTPNDSTFTLSTGPIARLTYWPQPTPRGFDKITVIASGGDDSATLSGASTGVNTFWAHLADAVLSDGTLDLSTGDLTTPRSPFGYYFKLSGFDTLADSVTASGPESATDQKHVSDPIDYSLAFTGTWLDI